MLLHDWCLEVIYRPLCKNVLRRFCVHLCGVCSMEPVLVHLCTSVPGRCMDTCLYLKISETPLCIYPPWRL